MPSFSSCVVPKLVTTSARILNSVKRKYSLSFPLSPTETQIFWNESYFGWQCHLVRTIQNDVNELKKQVKPVPITPDVNSVESSPPSPLELQIQQLTEGLPTSHKFL
ncbi:hypothetical protein P8452_16953 [Trifolium repens]|nr:hypothetical protein P8452_16953 [Trifolium repens]